MRIRAVQAAFQTVENHQTRLMASLFRRFAPGEIQKITVWQVKPLPVRGELNLAADQSRQHGLQMGIGHAAHRHELSAVFGRNVEV